MEGKNLVQEKSFDFALAVIKLCKVLRDQKEFVLSKQLLRSGTSVGAMVRESQNAESKLDFIHKLSVAQKECDETIYWLELLFRSGEIIQSDFESVYKEATEIHNILKRIIISIKSNLNK